MEVKVFSYLPAEAKEIRERVFIIEQGFQKEYDQIDQTATHLVLYYHKEPVATCRIFSGEQEGTYILGRLAVEKPWRKKGIGSRMLEAAEEWVRKTGGSSLMLHSQLNAVEFYEKSHYTASGQVEYEEDCPHIWMKKDLK